MARLPIEEHSRMAIRIRPEDKSTIMRAASIAHTDITSFVLQNVLPAARSIIANAERLAVSERDSAKILDLIEQSPRPNDRLRAAARALPKDS